MVPGSGQARVGPGLRRWLRRVLRASSALAGTLLLSVAFLAWLPGHVGRRRRWRWRTCTLRAWARWMLLCTGIRLSVHGEPPARAGLIVCNHVGYADILVLASQAGGVFVAAAELRRWPLIGFMGARVGTVFLDRADRRTIPRVRAAMRAALEQGVSVVFFPEGGNSSGRELRRFGAALFDVAGAGALPVRCAVLHYATPPGSPPASRSVAWFDRPLLEQTLDFLALERIEARLTWCPGELWGGDRRQLAAAAQALVAGSFQPLE